MEFGSRARSLLTAIVMTVAALAVLATTPADDSSLDETGQGPPVLLTPTQRTATARFTFQSNDAAFAEARGGGLDVTTDSYWLDPPDRPAIKVSTDVRKVAGPPLDPDWFDGSVSCTQALPSCRGTYEVTFAWPPELDSGAVRVEWTASARISYSTEEPPKDAELIVEVGTRTSAGTAPARFHEHRFSVPSASSDLTQSLRIRSSEAIPSTVDLAIEVAATDTTEIGTDPVLTVRRHGSRTVLRNSAFAPLDVPARCRVGPCSFAFTIEGHGSSVARRLFEVGLTASRELAGVSVAVKYRRRR